MSDPTEVIADFCPGGFVWPRDWAQEVLDALRAEGFELYRPEECKHVSGSQKGVWFFGGAPSEGEYRLVPVSEGTEQ